jgi:succinoglycan biosynthesis transport protein ExoP
MQQTDMTPLDYLAILKRRKWSLMLPAGLVFLLAVLVAVLLPSIYRSEATILIEAQEIPANFVESTVTSYVEQRIQTINQRIMSFSTLLKIINDHGLYPEMKDSYTAEEIVEKMRSDITLEPLSADVVDRHTGRPTTATIAFNLSYEGKNPQKVQAVANVLTSHFLEENLKERVQQVEQTSAFLETEVDRIKAELSQTESKIAVFKQQHISELPEMLQVNLQGLNNTQRSIEAAQQELRSLKERAGYFKTQLASVDPYVKDEEEQASTQRLEELKVQLVALTKRFSDEYPDVKKTRAEIKDLQKTIGTPKHTDQGAPDNPAYITLAAQLASVRADIKSVQEQIESLTADAARYQSRMAATPAVEDEYNDLMITRNNTQAKFDDLMGKLMEAQVAHGLEKEQKGERFSLIDAPRLPEKPFKPNRLAIILIGIVLGGGTGVGSAVLREFSDDRVHGVDMLQKATRLPVLAGIPVIWTPQELVRKHRQRIGVACGLVVAVIVALAIVHFTIIDLQVVWVSLTRKVAI